MPELAKARQEAGRKACRNPLVVPSLIPAKGKLAFQPQRISLAQQGITVSCQLFIALGRAKTCTIDEEGC